MSNHRKPRGVALIVLVLVFLVACGPEPESTPTPAQPTVSGSDERATPPVVATPEMLTLGDLAVRITNAWDDVSAYRITSTGATGMAPPPGETSGTPVSEAAATPGATPVARERGTFTFVREVVLPDQQRQVVSGLGANDYEAISTNDRLFIRGPVTAQIAPDAPPDVWISVEKTMVPDGSLFSQLLGGLPQAPAAPLSTLPQRLWPQQVRDLGIIQVNGRDCQIWGAADTAQATGMRLDYSIAVDAGNLPCFIETSAGGAVQGHDEYEILDSLTIEEPAAATPVSIPPALATPAAHD